ncbi:helix-turn-helix domain-containing protein [Streptomyces sp. CA-111067]|uniref:helix-turn-helix domain-containing protein n=1 Tax=Streptomyces sp. CA-111067 TaxID=3240046 RepID=UPI003D980EC2
MPVQPSRGQRGPRIVSDFTGRAPTAQRMIYGEILRRRREACGLTEVEAARRTGFSTSKISRLENGLHDFKEADVRRLLSVYQVTDPVDLDGLLEMAQEANERGWWDPWSDVSTKALQIHVSLEDIAQRIRSYENGQLQGLLQTADYTRALIRANAPGKSRQEIDRIIELRMLRQQRFTQSSNATLWCVIDEVTLVRGYGSKAVMQRQLDHLLKLADHPRIIFHMVEMASLNMPVQIGTTTVFDFENGRLPDIVYVERSRGGLYLYDPEQVDEHVMGFDRLLVASMRQRACIRRIHDHRKRLG